MDITLNGIPQKLYRYDVDDTPVNAEVDVPPSSNWAFDHAADLDAHMSDMFQLIRTGEYFKPITYRNTSTNALTTDRLYAMPFFVARSLTIDRLAIEVTIAAAGGSIARLGIYNNGANLYPGTLIVDAGTVLVDAIAEVAATIAEALTGGLYWLALVSDSNPTLRVGYTTWSPLGQLATNFGHDNEYMRWQLNAVGAGALADPFVGGAAAGYAYFPIILPRLLSLD